MRSWKERGSHLPNIDPETVTGFGEEWTTFDQTHLSESEASTLFDQYFAIFPWELLPPDAEGFDLGCGSGRWARRVSDQVGKLHCIDASEMALRVAQRNLSHLSNCEFHHASVDSIPLAEGSMDFGYSLGVLHHLPDTEAGISACVDKLKPGAPLLIYVYYDFEGRPAWFRGLWKASDFMRRGIARLPSRTKMIVTTVIATLVYLPLARFAKVVERSGRSVTALPLSYYRDLSFYTMRTDALDRFGTPLEKRFSRTQIQHMMEKAGLERVRFSGSPPYWCAVGFKRSEV